jgi:hypothetical protein
MGAKPPSNGSIVGPGMMTRILYYIPLLLLGGTERQLLNLVTNLDRRRFEPLVWATDGRGPVGDMLRGAGIRGSRTRDLLDAKLGRNGISVLQLW